MPHAWNGTGSTPVKLTPIAAVVLGALGLLAACGPDVPIPEGERPIGTVDTPQPGAVVKPMPLLVGGWALGPEGVRELEVYLGDDLKGVTRTTVARPDVAQAFPDRAGKHDRHGWNLEIDPGPARGPQVLRVRVRDGQGRVADLATVPIVIEPW